MEKRLLPIILMFLVASVLSAPEQRNGRTWLLTMKSGTEEIVKTFSTMPKNSMSRTNKLNHLVGSLKAHANASQKNVVDLLNQEKTRMGSDFSFEVLWISNQIILRGADSQLIEKLSGRPDVAKIVKDVAFHLDTSELVTSNVVRRSKNVNAVSSWGIDKIEAPAVWAQGYNGSGIIVATIDSGAQGNHEALQPNFVGQDNFGWFDPIESSTSPFDDLGHGTHTMGTIAGYFKDASGETKIGVAPGAKWMACKGCTGDNWCWASDVESCFQFLLCPRGQDGGECDPSKAPHVINNSYFIDYPRRSGTGTRDDVVESALDALQAAGIVMVFSIGNAYYCESAGYPGDYKNVIGVGSTTSGDDLSSFSSSGPGTTHGSAEIKPEVVAPGSSIVSSVIGNGHEYGSKSGTSMAGPHVAGVVALMLSKNVDLSVSQVRQILFNSTEQMSMSETRNCGGIPDTKFPNFSLGYGRVNALTAVDAVAEP